MTKDKYKVDDREAAEKLIERMKNNPVLIVRSPSYRIIEEDDNVYVEVKSYGAD